MPPLHIISYIYIPNYIHTIHSKPYTYICHMHVFISTDMRFSQLEEEKNHKNVTDSHKNELLQKKLERLRALKDEIAQDEWMFEDNR